MFRFAATFPFLLTVGCHTRLFLFFSMTVFDSSCCLVFLSISARMVQGLMTFVECCERSVPCPLGVFWFRRRLGGEVC